LYTLLFSLKELEINSKVNKSKFTENLVILIVLGRSIRLSKVIHGNLYIIYSLVLLLYVVNTFLMNTTINYLVGVLALPMLLISFWGASKLFRILGIIFITVGIFLFIYSGLPFYSLPLYTTSTMPLLAFLAVLPWMNSVVKAGRYDRRMNDLMKAKTSNLGNLYIKSSFTTYILVTFISLSGLSITQEVLIENISKLKKKVRDSFISRTTLRAFACAVTWSPVEVIVAITVDATGISYLMYLPWLILCSVVVLLFDWLCGKKRFAKTNIQQETDQSSKGVHSKKIAIKILQLLVALTIFLIIVVTIGSYFHLNFILSVTLVILPFASGWALLTKRWRSYLAVGVKTWKTRTNNMQNYVVLFLSLAIFSNSLNVTPFLQIIQQPFLSASELPIAILLLIQFTYILMALIGVHPIATIGILIEVLKPLYTIVNPLSIGMVLITSALATATIGAYGLTVTMTSITTNENPYRITVRNMPFALFYGGVGTFIGFLLL